MQWYKHDTNASSDAKIRKLLLRHGPVGYAIYFHCLELIAGDFGQHNITFELEHDAEIIADNLKIKGTNDKSGIDIVNEVMHYIVELGLFEQKDNRIFCFKLIKRLDTSMTSNPAFRKIIKNAKDNHDRIMIASCKTDKTRQDRQDQTDTQDDLLDRVNRIHSELFRVDVPVRDQVDARELARLFTDESIRHELRKAAGVDNRRASAIHYVAAYMLKPDYKESHPVFRVQETDFQRAKREAY